MEEKAIPADDFFGAQFDTKPEEIIVEKEEVVKEDVVPKINLDDDYSEGEPITEVEDAVSSFLSLYGVDSKAIKYVDEDGKESTTSWAALNPKEQFEYMTSLTEQDTPDLAEDEVSLLTAIRQSDMTAEEYLQAYVEQELQNYQQQPEGESSDLDVFAYDYRTSVDESATDEEIQEEFEKLKDTKSFEKRIAKMRESIEEARILEYQQEVEQQREEIIEKVIGIDNIIDGMVLPDDRKNHVLNKMLNVDEYGNSEFVNEYFSEPEKLYKLVALAEFGQEYMNQLHQYYKAEIVKAKEEARNEALGKLPDKKIVIEADDNDNKGGKVIKPKAPTVKSLADIHGGI